MRTTTAIDEEADMSTTTEAVAVTRFRGRDGERHTVLVRRTDEGWEIVDAHGEEETRIELLSDPQDDRGCAEAVARDYARCAAEPDWARVA
jgi:hypothetical protein